MDGKQTSGFCKFDILFTKICVPHIQEKIFFSLDYESFKTCLKVNSTWSELFTSESYQKKRKSVFHDEILEDARSFGKDEMKLWLAARHGDTVEVRKLLLRTFVYENCVNGWLLSTPLYEAADNGHKDVAQFLLDGGVDPNKADKYGYTPLHQAVSRGYTDVVQILIFGGANPNKATVNGWTPLQAAALKGDKDMVQLLLDSEANETNSARQKDLHDNDLVGCTFKSEPQKETPKRKKKLTQKDMGKIVKRAIDKKEGKREVPVKRVNATCKAHILGFDQLNFTTQEISVGVHSQGIIFGGSGMKLQEDKDGNVRMHLSGIYDIVLNAPKGNANKDSGNNQIMTKESGTKSKKGTKEESDSKSKKGAKEDTAETVRVNITKSQDDSGKNPDAERDSPSSESSAASIKSANDVAFDRNRYMRVLESMKVIFKCPDECNKVEIGKWQHDIIKDIKGKINDNVDDADELSTCLHCGMVEFDLLRCSGCRVARFCDMKACRENFLLEHHKSDQCKKWQIDSV